MTLAFVQTEMYRHHWELAVDDALENLTGTSPDGLFFISSRIGDFQQTAMEHLACFFPGNIALGVMEGAVADSAKAARYLEAAEKLTFSCWQMYERTASGTNFAIRLDLAEAYRIIGHQTNLQERLVQIKT